MKIDAKFKIREIAGEHVIVNQGSSNANLTKIISLNASACVLFEAFVGREFTLEDAAGCLVEHYGIDGELARKDAESWAEALKNCGIIVD